MNELFGHDLGLVWLQAETGRRRTLLGWLELAGPDRPSSERDLEDFAAIMGIYETPDHATCGRCAELADGSCAGVPGGSCTDWVAL